MIAGSTDDALGRRKGYGRVVGPGRRRASRRMMAINSTLESLSSFAVVMPSLVGREGHSGSRMHDERP